MYTPPPNLTTVPNSGCTTTGVPSPPRKVKPSMIVSAPSPLVHVTTLPSRPVASMIVPATTNRSVGTVLRSVSALPCVLRRSLYVPGAMITSPPTATRLMAACTVG